MGCDARQGYKCREISAGVATLDSVAARVEDEGLPFIAQSIFARARCNGLLQRSLEASMTVKKPFRSPLGKEKPAPEGA